MHLTKTPPTNAELHNYSSAQQRILDLMQDGEWHAASAIIGVSRIRAGLRSMRKLREKGFDIESYQQPKSKDWFYKLNKS